MSENTRTVIYQLVVRYFGNTNLTNAWAGDIGTNGCGKFNDIDERAIAAIKDLGATHIWLTGCLRQATLTSYPLDGLEADDPDIVKGRAGSFYAVRDYFDVCPDYAVNVKTRMDEFVALIDRIHAQNLKVLIDFVPNHVARSYRSLVRPDLDFDSGDDQSQFFSQQNCFYYLNDPPGQSLRLSHPLEWERTGLDLDGRFEPEDGAPGHTPKATANAWPDGPGASPTETDWYEATKLNFGFNYVNGTGHYDPIPRTWTILDHVLSYWQGKGVDGFRCDMAHLVPEQAWQFLISRARSQARNPNVLFLAEAYVGTAPADPVKTLAQLLDAGFDAVYHDNSYNRLVDVYRGGGLNAYDAEMRCLSGREWQTAVEYLENHDKPRVAAPLNRGGFGNLNANYQLAPLQFLYSCGPALLLNGQEVGEYGAGAEGFSGDDGRTTFFDYWCMPEFAKWVNGKNFDGGQLSPSQAALRSYLRDLLHLCQDPAVTADGYWSLKYCNSQTDHLYAFARFAQGSGRLLVVAANFDPGGDLDTTIHIPNELIQIAGCSHYLSVKLLLDRTGRQDLPLADISSQDLAGTGFPVTIGNQEARVFEITSR